MKTMRDTLQSIRSAADDIYHGKRGDAELSVEGNRVKDAYHIREWADKLLHSLPLEPEVPTARSMSQVRRLTVQGAPVWKCEFCGAVHDIVRTNDES